MLRIHHNGQDYRFDVQEYQGQDYNGDDWALTVVIVQGAAEVYLVPLESIDPYHRDKKHLKIEELMRYLDMRDHLKTSDGNTPPELCWTMTHTVYKFTHAEFENKHRTKFPIPEHPGE